MSLIYKSHLCHEYCIMGIGWNEEREAMLEKWVWSLLPGFTDVRGWQTNQSFIFGTSGGG